MQAVLPGKPQARTQAACTTRWKGHRIITYISGNALVILDGPHHIIQTVYQDDCGSIQAVAIDEITGKIATCSDGTIHVYRPHGEDQGVLKWSLQNTFFVENRDENTQTLSWGASEELLVGSSSLRLFQTAEDERLIWSRELSSPVSSALFSGDASLIASTGRHDRLIKIWRRLSYGSDDVRFNFSYLPHPATVTGMEWRKPHHPEYNGACTLYSVCADSKVRVWAATDPHGLQVLQLWSEVDVAESIQPRYMEPQDQPKVRYVFMISSTDFSSAIERTAKNAGSARSSPALEHLIDIAQQKPEVCVVLDNKGHMSAWGLENIGGKHRAPTDVFNVAHSEDVDLLMPNDVVRGDEGIRFLNFVTEDSYDNFVVLVHHFNGKITWIEGRIDEFFNPSPLKTRFKRKALWTGHDGQVKKIVRTVNGRAIMSRTDENAGLIWRQNEGKDQIALSQSSSLNSAEHIHRTCLLAGGKVVANLHHGSISIWDAHDSEAIKVACCTFKIEGKPLCLLRLPSFDSDSLYVYLATISSHMKGIVWQLDLQQMKLPQIKRHSQNIVVSQFCTFDLGIEKDLAFVIPIDPAGSTNVASGFLDTFAKDVAISYTDSGVLRAWTAKLDVDRGAVDWLTTAILETGVEQPSLASGSSIRKIALVNASRNELTIWDSKNSQLEFEAIYASHDTIQDLDWASTPDNQSVLAVGFPHKVRILAQIRYDYLDRGPAWASIREITIRHSTPHPIGDSTWLGNGNLVVGAGNQLFVYNKLLKASDGMVSNLMLPVHGHVSMDLFDMVALLNGPLPVFHPQFLGQCILAGKLAQVQKIIVKLNKALQFFTDGGELESSMNLPIEEFFMEEQMTSIFDTKEMQSAYADFSDDEEDAVTESLAVTLNENLSKIAVPHLSSHEQIHLADMVECIATVQKHRRSMDDHAMHFLLFFRQHVIRKAQAPEKHIGVTWREIAWAFHSGSQDILVDLVTRTFRGKMLWSHAKESGMLMWISDVSALRAQFEVIARNEYTKTDEKNPTDCSLYYLALKKKNILLGLWRMASWNREQSATQKLLSNNFHDPRWQTAALKNAYALLGRRRFKYAAAFFLLAGHLRDAVSICANQLQDIQLAIAIARVYEGDNGPVLHEFLEEKVLPLAAFEGNRWLATWAFWMLGRRDMAVRALISPVYTLLNSPATPSQQAKSYLATDPAIVVLYRYLRDKTLQTLKGASKISPRVEWEFIMQTARLYERMGCDILALDLVRNWEFLKQPRTVRERIDTVSDPRRMLRRRSSLVVDDLPSPRSPKDVRGAALSKPPPPKVFEEPSANSLLDSFGF